MQHGFVLKCAHSGLAPRGPCRFAGVGDDKGGGRDRGRADEPWNIVAGLLLQVTESEFG